MTDWLADYPELLPGEQYRGGRLQTNEKDEEKTQQDGEEPAAGEDPPRQE